jgi:hypothetical protein
MTMIGDVLHALTLVSYHHDQRSRSGSRVLLSLSKNRVMSAAARIFTCFAMGKQRTVSQ